jgi:hypothetical protein
MVCFGCVYLHGVGIGVYSRKMSRHILMGGVISEHGDIE